LFSINYDAMTYLLLTFGGCLGMYQVAAVAGGFKGLWFFRQALPTLILGLMIIGATFIWFFTCADLNMNANDAAVVEGHEQLSFFLLGAFVALLLTYAVSSLVHRNGVVSYEEPVIGKGIEDLKTMTVFQAASQRWSNRKKTS